MIMIMIMITIMVMVVVMIMVMVMVIWLMVMVMIMIMIIIIVIIIIILIVIIIVPNTARTCETRPVNWVIRWLNRDDFFTTECQLSFCIMVPRPLSSTRLYLTTEKKSKNKLQVQLEWVKISASVVSQTHTVSLSVFLRLCVSLPVVCWNIYTKIGTWDWANGLTSQCCYPLYNNTKSSELRQ